MFIATVILCLCVSYVGERRKRENRVKERKKKVSQSFEWTSLACLCCTWVALGALGSYRPCAVDVLHDFNLSRYLVVRDISFCCGSLGRKRRLGISWLLLQQEAQCHSLYM